MATERPLLKRDILYAQSKSKSANGAARFLKVSYPTYKKYAELYGIFVKNQSGKGVRRIIKKHEKNLLDVMEGRTPYYSKRRFKERIIKAGIKEEVCDLCGYSERSIVTNRVPLSLFFKDGDTNNAKLENLEFRCFNCTYLTTGKWRPADGAEILQPRHVVQDIQSSRGVTDEELQSIQESLLEEFSKDSIE